MEVWPTISVYLRRYVNPESHELEMLFEFHKEIPENKAASPFTCPGCRTMSVSFAVWCHLMSENKCGHAGAHLQQVMEYLDQMLGVCACDRKL